MRKTKVIKIFEDKQLKINLTEQEEKDILFMKEIIGENNVILQADGTLLVRHYVGFIQVNKTRLLIYPKISRNSMLENEYSKSWHIIMKLLAYSGFGRIKKIPSPQNMDKYKGDILELFIGLFIDELLLQFKRDVNRGYINQLENQSFIKGKVNFSETIKRNSFKKHLHYVQYDQFSEDILMNRVFKSIILNLITRTDSKHNKIKLMQSLLWLEDVERISLDNEIWRRVNFTRHNLKYEAAFNMAKLFYYNSSPNLNRGDEHTFSFLVPVNELFELYLYKVLNSKSQDSYIVQYQKPTRYLAKEENQNYLQLKPDITLVNGNDAVCIIDAKYKELVLNEENVVTNRDDIYQMLAYSVGYRCDCIALMYPRFLSDDPNEPSFKELTIKNYDKVVSIKLIKIDLEMEPDLLGDKLIRILGY